ncbi:MAG: hypothetical protein OQL19_09880 [Gammaproteobacteria bacterium]|nr:hypothetical protein [Gammaproteobacteria bacterium]
MEINTLKKRWEKLFQFKKSKEEFYKVAQHYGENNRFYHTLEHIDFCLSLFDNNYNKIEHPDEFEISLWLHDVIYKPKMLNNEELSAEYADNMLSLLGFETHKIDKVRQIIMSTKHPSVPTSNDEKYLIDIDLAILGTSNAIYEHYSDMIRKEYSYLPAGQYIIGRKQILESFVNSEFIFHTDTFRETYELIARKNIKNELLKYS